MTTVPAALHRPRWAGARPARVTTMTALVAVVAAWAAAVAGMVAGRAGAGTVPAPASPTVAFVVALRTFETSDVALADQAAAQSETPAVRAAAAALVVHGDAVAADLWALLDRWRVPGVDRLPPVTAGAAGAPPPGAGPTLVLHHDCTVYVNDELARLTTLSGSGFDRRFVGDWVAHATTALQSLSAAGWDSPGAPRLSAPGLRPIVHAAEEDLRHDLSAVARLN